MHWAHRLLQVIWRQPGSNANEGKPAGRHTDPLFPPSTVTDKHSPRAGLLLKSRGPRGANSTFPSTTIRTRFKNLLPICCSIHCLNPAESTTFLLCYFISLWSSLLWPHVRLIFLFRGSRTKFPLVGLTSAVGPSCLDTYKVSGSHHPFPTPGVRKCKHSGWPLTHIESY